MPRGDPQAELTEIQIRDRDARLQGRAELNAARAYALIERYGAEWAREVLTIASQPRFYRGFVEAVTLDGPTFLRRASDLYAIAPIRAVTLVDAANHIDAIAASPHLSRLVSLQFYNKSHDCPLGDSGLRTLVSSPFVTRLAMLRLGFNDIGRDGIEALAAARLPRLAYVSLGNNREASPVDAYSEDAFTGAINNSSITETQFGRDLEVRYGEQRWLHAPSLVPSFPPNEGDF